MSHPSYVQIFSMTDHAKALHDRYEGSYNGINAELQTSEIVDGDLKISKHTKVQQSEIPEDYFNDAKIILSYRHSDTGVLNGTSETLFSILKTPWEDMPGISFSMSEKNILTIKLWSQEMMLKVNQVYKVHFGKTMVYIKNFGAVSNIEFTDDLLVHGASSLHSEEVNQNISIAPESGSAIQVKMGQETQN